MDEVMTEEKKASGATAGEEKQPADVKKDVAAKDAVADGKKEACDSVKDTVGDSVKDTVGDNVKDTVEDKNAAGDKKADVKDADVKKKADDDGEEVDDEDLDVDELFKSRRSVPLTPANARFYRSAGNLISLDLTNTGEDAVERGEHEIFERVVVLRSFPISNPNEFLSIREPDTRKKGRGKEIGMIRHIDDFDADTVAVLNEELALRYFTPEITKITNVKEKFGYSYWEAETTAGKVTFVLDNPFSNVRTLEDGRVFISDMDGNAFTVPDPEKLDKASQRRIEVYI